MDEIWKDIPGYEGQYQVSILGKVRSLPRDKPQKIRRKDGTCRIESWHYKGKVLKPVLEGRYHKHAHVRLYDVNGKRQTFEVSYLVLQNFCPDVADLVWDRKATVIYADGNCYNCALQNLFVIPKQ